MDWTTHLSPLYKGPVQTLSFVPVTVGGGVEGIPLSGGGSTLLIRQWSLMVDHLSCGSVEPEVYTQVQHDVVHACSPLHPMETKDI